MLHQVDPHLVPMERQRTTLANTLLSISDDPPVSRMRQETLSLKLGAVIESGATAVVYDVDIEDDELRYSLPPLVVKIARPSRQRRLEREKFFYDYMQDSQGVILAQCYGFYKGEVTSSSVTVDLWAQDLDPAKQFISSSAQEPIDEDEYAEGEEYAEALAYAEAHYDDPKDPVLHLLNTPGPHTHVSVLIVEKLGERLPLGAPLSPDLMYVVLSISALYMHCQTLSPFHFCLPTEKMWNR